MKRVLLFSHSGFSDENANGITMKNLLSAWNAEEKAEFYCDVQPPDYSAAYDYFRVTDVQAIKAFLGKKGHRIFRHENEKSVETKNSAKASVPAKKIPLWLKKHKYNFFLKWFREYIKQISPWGHSAFKRWVREISPDVIVYMVGESFFMDDLVLKVCRDTGKPLVLYNGEAYRIIDLKTRKGLERAYYRKTSHMYSKLNDAASLVIYNCEMLKDDYEARYSPKSDAIVAFNSAKPILEPYEADSGVKITYFGNLGVGRSPVLLRAADILGQISSELKIDIYGNAMPEYVKAFNEHPNISYCGFVDSETLERVVKNSDILLHVESFEKDIIPKLKYAFSTKIAQCLCSGRCFVSYAPSGTASSVYLASNGGAVMVSDENELKNELQRLVSDSEYRKLCAERAYKLGLENHVIQTTAQSVREKIESVL